MSAALTTNVDQRLLRTTKFPPEFNVKVDMKKVNIHLIKSWAQTEIARILQNDDDIVTELVANTLEENRYPKIKEMQISLGGFLDKDAAAFCESLWKLCLSAQDNPQGIPKELIEAKKAELTQEKVEKEKAREEAIKREEAERERERETARIRERERNERSRGRGGRNGRDYDRRPPRDSTSPPSRRRDDDDFRSNRRADTYIPSNSGRRRRSPSYDRASTRSRSPPPRRRRQRDEDSRSPPRRKRRNTSSERSASPERNGSRSKYTRRRGSRSPSPRRDRRRLSRTRSRSPPAKRSRRESPSPPPRGSTSVSLSPPRRKKTTDLASNDLMAASVRKDRPDNLRLSRETSPPNSSSSQTPGAEVAEEFSVKGAARRQNLAREALLKKQLMAEFAARRAAAQSQR